MNSTNLAICLLGMCLLGSSSAFAAELSVTVHNVNQEAGYVRVVVYDNASFLTHDAPYIQSLDPRPGDLVAKFDDIPLGNWGILAYHDANDNTDLDRNMIGIPTEQFGFSNNPGFNHRPDFSEVEFAIAHQPVALEIKLSD